MADTNTHRRGPKPEGPFKDQRLTLTTRITEAMRAKIEDAATASGRSLSQEIELRLDRSFQTQDFLADAQRLAYGRQGATFLRLIGEFVRAGASRALTVESDWLSDATAYNVTERAIVRVLDRLRPQGNPMERAETPERLADRLLWILGTENPDDGEAPWAASMRAGFGKEIADHLIEMRKADLAGRYEQEREAEAADPENQAGWDSAFRQAGIVPRGPQSVEG